MLDEKLRLKQARETRRARSQTKKQRKQQWRRWRYAWARSGPVARLIGQSAAVDGTRSDDAPVLSWA
jgi:hypothetical protein